LQAIDELRHTRHRGVVGEAAEIDFHPEAGVNSRGRDSGRQRVTAKVHEEVFVMAHLVELQGISPDVGHQRLRLAR
jgi:hypothetical protein